MNPIYKNTLASLLLLLSFIQMGMAQEDKNISNRSQTTETASIDKTPEDAESNSIKTNSESTYKAKPVASPKAKPECKLCRWLEVETATITARYRFIENSNSTVTNNQVQDSQAFKGRFKFDSQGKYSLNAGVASGNGFTSGWNNTGIGTGDLVTNLYLKQLYVSAKPIKNVEVQYGGLYFNRGESTEITSYDNDGYLMGQRVIVKRPQDLFFDEVSVTYAYLGDLGKSNINKRFFRLKESNYHQFLVGKKIGKRASVSVDYTFQAGTEVMREAVKMYVKELGIVDSLRVETYQRVDVKPDYGFAVGGEKLLFKRLTLSGGYARIDPNYGGLNGDRYGKGNRLLANSSFSITPEFTVSSFATRGLGNDYALGNRTRLELHFSYNLLKSLQKTSLLK